jgi:hypothetical protein
MGVTDEFGLFANAKPAENMIEQIFDIDMAADPPQRRGGTAEVFRHQFRRFVGMMRRRVIQGFGGNLHLREMTLAR